MTRSIDPRLADSEAARMLSVALKLASAQRGLSLRKIAALLDYKQAVVLSHMATGRVPIPIDKAEEIAKVLEIDAREFLKAVVEQRHPDVKWSLLSDVSAPLSGDPVRELTVSLSNALDQLNDEQRSVIREVAADPQPRRRWLNTRETALIEALRQAWAEEAVERLPRRDEASPPTSRAPRED